MSTRKIGLVAGLAAGMVMLLAGMANAATITYVGTVTNDANNEISEWRTSTTAKSYDIDGDNIYGTAGSLFFIINGDFPSYVGYGGSQSQVGPYAGYATVDDPRYPVNSSSNTQVRTTTSGAVAVGSTNNMFWFNITSAPPPYGFRVGVATDGLNAPGYSSQEIRLTQLAGGSATAAADVSTIMDAHLDMVFFDVKDAVVGDQFAVQGIAGAGGYATHQLVTWDDYPNPPLAAGDVIAVDFSSTGGSANNYNVFSSWTNIADGDVINYNNGKPINGITLTAATTAGGNGFNDDGAAANWPGTAADPYYVTDADDIAYANGPVTLTFAGLSDDLIYNVRVYSLIGNLGARTQTFTVTDGSGTKTATSSADYRWNSSTLEAAGTVFSKVRTDGSGNIVVSIDTVTPGDYYALNAVVLEAKAIRGTLIYIK